MGGHRAAGPGRRPGRYPPPERGASGCPDPPTTSRSRLLLSSAHTASLLSPPLLPKPLHHAVHHPPRPARPRRRRVRQPPRRRPRRPGRLYRRARRLPAAGRRRPARRRAGESGGCGGVVGWSAQRGRLAQPPCCPRAARAATARARATPALSLLVSSLASRAPRSPLSLPFRHTQKNPPSLCASLYFFQPPFCVRPSSKHTKIVF